MGFISVRKNGIVVKEYYLKPITIIKKSDRQNLGRFLFNVKRL